MGCGALSRSWARMVHYVVRNRQSWTHAPRDDLTLAPACPLVSRTKTLCRVLGHLGPATQLRVPPKAPPKPPASLPLTIQVCAIAGIASASTFGTGVQQELCVVSATLDTAETAIRATDTAAGSLQACHYQPWRVHGMCTSCARALAF